MNKIKKISPEEKGITLYKTHFIVHTLHKTCIRYSHNQNNLRNNTDYLV